MVLALAEGEGDTGRSGAYRSRTVRPLAST